MLFNHRRLTKTVVIFMTTVLSGCAVRPGLSFPISVSRAVDGEVVSLNSVSQHGQTALYQSARSVRTPQNWPHPSRQSVAMPPSHPIRSGSHSIRQAQHQPSGYPTQKGAVPFLHYPQQAATHHNQRPTYNGQVIRQASQQQAPPPIVIQWDDHQQSTGSHRSVRSFTNGTSNTSTIGAAQGLGSQAGQISAPYCPPNTAAPHTVHRVGDGCGESNQSVDFDQINKLVQRVEKMESELTTSNKSIKRLTSSLASARMEISKLKRDVNFWQSEVVRLERSMKAQHRSDIASLNQISKVLETLLIEEGGTQIKDDVPPDFDVAIDPFAPNSR